MSYNTQTYPNISTSSHHLNSSSPPTTLKLSCSSMPNFASNGRVAVRKVSQDCGAGKNFSRQPPRNRWPSPHVFDVFFLRQYNWYLGLALILLPVSYRKFIETLLSSFEKAYPTLKEKILQNQKVYDFQKTCGIGDNCKLLIKKKDSRRKIIWYGKARMERISFPEFETTCICICI